MVDFMVDFVVGFMLLVIILCIGVVGVGSGMIGSKCDEGVLCFVFYNIVDRY